MGDQNDRLGSSGMFKAIVDSARKFTRAVTGGDQELTPEARDFASKIAQAFVAGRFADVYAMGAPALQSKASRESFVTSWRDAVRPGGTLTGFEISDAGQIDLGFIPGLEEVPQSHFVAFLEIAFSSPDVTLEDDDVFTIGAVLVDEDGKLRLGAIHAR